MNSPKACEGEVLYWGSGFQAAPAEYGFIALHGDSELIHYFDQTHLADDSLPPVAGAFVSCAVVSESATGANPSQLKWVNVSKLGSPHRPRSWTATIGVITANGDSGGTLRSLDGQSARFTREATVGGCPPPEAFVRCRLLPPGNQGGSSRAFDVVAIDFTNPIEQARLQAYLAMTETPVSSPANAALPDLPRRRRSRRPEENSIPWISTGIAFDRGLGELHLPGKRIIKVPPRYRAVLRAMTAKTPDNPKLRTSFLTYEQVARKFEEGRRDAAEERAEKGKPPRKSKPRLVVEQEVEKQPGDRGRAARLTAQEFVRCFSKWLCRKRIEPNSVIECDYNAEAYGLAFGWSQHSVAKNDGEVTRELSGRAQESGDGEDAEEGRESDLENEAEE